jgi:hypothetical protein
MRQWSPAYTLFRNAVTALEGGATHVDTSVLGIGERESVNPERDNCRTNLRPHRKRYHSTVSVVTATAPLNLTNNLLQEVH